MGMNLDTGFKSPSASASVDTGVGAAWTNTSNIYTSNNVYATCDVGVQVSQRLAAKTFGISIPGNALIKGIVATIEGKVSGSDHVLTVRIYKNPYTVSPAAADVSNAKTTTITSTETTFTFGSSTDTWGETFTAADVNSTDFGVGLEIDTGLATYSIDHVQLKIYYETRGGSRVQFIGI